jgi:thymidine phosphorylase
MVARLGGPRDLLENPERHLPAAPVIEPVAAPRSGHVAAIATRKIGLAVVGLGGGRTRPEDRIDPAVGLSGLLPVGARVEAGDPMAFVHARSPDAAAAAAAAVAGAYTVEAEGPVARHPVIRRIA